jgi:CRP/FNR family cyclic AMP-dependent transcriptional regulator
MPTNADLLADIPLFRSLDERERATLASMVDEVLLPSGEPIFEYGAPGDSLFIIRSGEVEVFLTDDTGNRIVLERDGAGDVFGEIALLAPGPRTASAVANSAVEALRVDRHDLEEFLQLHSTAALDLLDVVGRRLRHTNDQLRHTASRNVNDQLADTRSTVQRVADAIAEFSGSIAFLVIHIVIFAAWLGFNSTKAAFDPYPFQLLTLAVSLEAIFLSTFVLLSQNRQAAKDRIRADIEYDVNLKAELEVAELHRKVDKLNTEVQALLGTMNDDLCARLDGLERAVQTNGRR